MPTDACAHIGAVTTDQAARKRHVCEECVKMGAQWVHLRTCQELRDDALLRQLAQSPCHAHARASGHPVIASAEPGERWLYCYPDDAFAES